MAKLKNPPELDELLDKLLSWKSGETLPSDERRRRTRIARRYIEKWYYTDQDLKLERSQREKAERELKKARLREKVSANDFHSVNTSLPSGEELVEILKEWAERVLVIPHGELQGQPFRMAQFQYDFIKNSFLPGKKENLLCIARKNAKSSIIAVLSLAVLFGPLNIPNFRITVVSLTGKLSAELRMLVENFFDASPELSEDKESTWKFNSTPAPGHIVGRNGARMDFLSADKSTGHAVGADIAVVDELGLITESQRELVDAAFSSLSARNGRLIALSIRGDGPHLQEMLDRQNLPHVYIQHHCLDKGDDPYDEKNWHKANPGIAEGIKSIDYMRSAAARANSNFESEPKFLAHDLNMRVDPSQNLIVSSRDYVAVLVDSESDLPPRRGRAVIGIDLGQGTSMTAGCAIWPATGRVEIQGAFPDTPGLIERGRQDHVGDEYMRFAKQGEIWVYTGRAVDPARFIEDVIAMWGEHGVDVLISDKYSSTLTRQTVENMGLPVKLITRYSAENISYDIGSARYLIMNRKVTIPKIGILTMGIMGSRIVVKADGGMTLEKSTSTSRIDALVAFVHAAGGMRHALSRRKVRTGWG